MLNPLFVLSFFSLNITGDDGDVLQVGILQEIDVEYCTTSKIWLGSVSIKKNERK